MARVDGGFGLRGAVGGAGFVALLGGLAVVARSAVLGAVAGRATVAGRFGAAVVGAVEAAALEDDGRHADLAAGAGAALRALLSDGGAEALRLLVSVAFAAAVFVYRQDIYSVKIKEEDPWGPSATIIAGAKETDKRTGSCPRLVWFV